MDKSCSLWSMGHGIESHPGHWWCQERHRTTIAPVLQRDKSVLRPAQKKTQFKVSHWDIIILDFYTDCLQLLSFVTFVRRYATNHYRHRRDDTASVMDNIRFGISITIREVASIKELLRMHLFLTWYELT